MIKCVGSEIRNSLNMNPLLPRIDRSRLTSFGHVSRMSQERLLNKRYVKVIEKGSM